MTARARYVAFAISAAAVAILGACGGGSGTAVGTASALSAANPGAVSTGAITAFGSVFVNGHEYSTTHASVIDDDTGSTTASTTGLEVGMVVDITAGASSSLAAPVASELHMHPLARGFVDATDTNKVTLSVMGQAVQASATTSFSDHRACVSAAASPCTAITGLSALTATSGSGASAVAGNYVTVHGYLFGNGSSPATANIVATLVSVSDAPPATATGAVFKAEGLVSGTGPSSITIGGLNVDLSKAVCYASGAATNCANAFSAGQVVSAFASASPGLPAINLTASAARLRSTLLVNTAGATVEIEGAVSNVTTSPAAFVVRGISVDASTLPSGTSLPAAGDIVSVLGTVGTSGTSVTATNLTVLRHAKSATYAFEGDISGVSSPAANTFVATVLGQTVTVTSASRLADESTKDWDAIDPATNPFNIATFQTYLAASTSQHVLVQTYADATGNLNVISLTIVPASTTDAVSGLVDATPAPVNSPSTGTATTFAVHGVAVGADPAAIRMARGSATPTISSGDEVTVFGTLSTTGNVLTVTAAPSRKNVVVDFGPPQSSGDNGF